MEAAKLLEALKRAQNAHEGTFIAAEDPSQLRSG
jgi:hypothetical protein